MSGRIRRLYDFELEPEVRDRLDSLSDSDVKRAGEVGGMLAEAAPNWAADEIECIEEGGTEPPSPCCAVWPPPWTPTGT